MPIAAHVIQDATGRCKNYFKAQNNGDANFDLKLRWNMVTDYKEVFKQLYTSLIDLKIKKYKTLLKPATTENTKEFHEWFNYFYTEARATPDSKDDFAIAMGAAAVLFFPLDKLFVVEVEAGPNKPLVKAKFKTDFVCGKPAGDSVSGETVLKNVKHNHLARHVLQYLLECGFEEAGTENVSDARLNGNHMFSRYFGLKSMVPAPATGAAITAQWRFGYRGDSRKPNEVVSHGGAKCRADLSFWRNDANVDQPWHPWGKYGSTTLNTKKMWFRKGSLDNDYFTANSIAFDFHIACAYPIMRSNEFFKDAVGDVNHWSENQRFKLQTNIKNTKPNRPNICKIQRTGTGKEIFALCDEMRVYVFLLETNTQVAKTWCYNVASKYPEAAIRTIPLESYVACLTVERVHVHPGSDPKKGYYDSTSASPVSMTCMVKKWEWISGTNGVHCGKTATGMGLGGVRLLEGRFNAVVNKPFDISHHSLVSQGATTFNFRTKKNVWLSPSTVRI